MKIALITGATSGIGKACAEILSKNGYKTILIGRRNEKLQSLSKKLNEPSLPLQLDVRVKDKVFNEISRLPNNFKKISIFQNAQN